MVRFKLRTKILLSYILLIAILVCGVYVIFDIFAISKLTDAHIQAAQQGVGDLSKFNKSLSEKTLKVLGKAILELLAERDANRASIYLTSKGSAYCKDYDKLRKDKKLREIVAHTIYVYGKEAGYTDMLDRRGVAVVHPNRQVEGQNFNKWQKQYPQMWDMVEDSFSKEFVSGYYKFINGKGEPEDKFMAICQIPGTDFNLVAAVSINNYFHPIHEKIQTSEQNLSQMVNRKIIKSSEASSYTIKIWSIPFFIGITLICILFGLWFSETLATPLKTLIGGVKNIGSGNFSVQVPERGSYEATELARAFNQLGKQLSDYTEHLKSEVSARQAVESEIKIARSIQESLLPRNFPAGEWFDVHAQLEPAKEVAGDFYDCFMHDDNLFMIIGDVSGKGVPAAFFMAVVRTMLRDLCFAETDPGTILSKANELLCEENEACMFVTLFLGIYDVEQGVLHYANGGHNEVLRLSATGEASSFGFTGDMALGILEGTTYQSKEEHIAPGETLVMYTDGITEAVCPKQVLYGIERLTEVVEKASPGEVKELCSAIVKDVLVYEQGNRFDDITVLSFRRTESA